MSVRVDTAKFNQRVENANAHRNLYLALDKIVRNYGWRIGCDEGDDYVGKMSLFDKLFGGASMDAFVDMNPEHNTVAFKWYHFRAEELPKLETLKKIAQDLTALGISSIIEVA